MAYEAYLDKEKRFKLQAKDASINHVNRIFYFIGKFDLYQTFK